MVEAIRQGDIPGVQLRCRQRLGAAPEEIWPWLVAPQRLGRWLGEAVAGEVALEAELAVGEERWVSRRLEPPRRWVFTLDRPAADWPAPTRVTLEIVPAPGGCELSALHEGFQRLPLSGCLTEWEAYRRRWRAALDRLAALL